MLPHTNETASRDQRVAPARGCWPVAVDVALSALREWVKQLRIAKLAVRYGLAAGRPTRLISTDTFRMGGTDLLRKYADAMGMRLETPANADALEPAPGI